MDARCVTSWTRSSDAAPGGASGAATPGSAAGRTRHEPDRPGGPGRPDVGEPLGAEERPRACAAVQHTDGAVRRAGLHARRPDHDPADPLPALTGLGARRRWQRRVPRADPAQWRVRTYPRRLPATRPETVTPHTVIGTTVRRRSEEHTSELQSRPHLVCR